MKKALILAISVISFLCGLSQSQLDTVYVRHCQLKGEEWWWGIKGINQDNLDSIQSIHYNKLIRAIKDASISSSTNFTYDSLPGPFAMIFFLDYWNNPEARENMGQGIDNKMRAYPPLAPYISAADIERTNKFKRRKLAGKHRAN